MAVALFVTFSARTVIQKYLSLVVKRIRVGPNRVYLMYFTRYIHGPSYCQFAGSRTLGRTL